MPNKFVQFHVLYKLGLYPHDKHNYDHAIVVKYLKETLKRKKKKKMRIQKINYKIFR